MDKLQVVYRDIKTLHPYKNNAKKHPKEQIAQIAESIRQFGFVNPVLIDKDNNVVAGHGRCLAAKKIGMKSVPTIKKDNWTEEEVKAFRLIENKLNESEWDFSLLDQEIEDLLQSDLAFDMSVFGFDTDLTDEDLEKAMEKEVRFKTKEKHLVIVPCKSEKETIKVQKEIEKLGYKCDIKNT